jgi:flavin reductase (DIM6/NTAB) family NADH-FMN oxidoreductase RutF
VQKNVPYEKAIRRKYPEQVVIALARDPDGKVNPITLGWTMVTSHDPPMLAISVGKTRYSLEVIRQAGEFVVAFPSEGMADDALFFGTHSGRDMDKLAERGTLVDECDGVDALLLSEAVANFECVLEGELETGDHVVFAGRVVASHVNENEAVARLYTLAPGYVLGGVRAGR